MRKQFKKGVAILSAVSMVAAGISYVPNNVRAEAPMIAVQDGEEGVDYSKLTYTQVGETSYYVAANNDEFEFDKLENQGTQMLIIPKVAVGTKPIWPNFTDITLNGEDFGYKDGAGLYIPYDKLKDNSYNVIKGTSASDVHEFQIIIKAGNPDASTDVTTTEETKQDTTTEETKQDTTTTQEVKEDETTPTTKAPEITTPGQVIGLGYAGNEALPFYFSWQGVTGATGYNVYLDGTFVAKADGSAYNFDKELFKEARDYVIEVAAINGAGEGTKASFKYTVEAKETDTTKSEETDTTKSEEADTTKSEEADTTKSEEADTTKSEEADTTKSEEADTSKGAETEESKETDTTSSTVEEAKAPVAVTGLAYTGTEEAAFKFSWNASEGAESYNVYLNDNLVNATITPEYNFDSTLFENAGTYIISVEAVNEAGKSDKTSITYVVKEKDSSTTEESKKPVESSTDESQKPVESSVEESKVTMPESYTVIENNADYGVKLAKAPAEAKINVSTD